MLGWWISIYKKVDFENSIDKAKKLEGRLATWETSVGGIDWLEKLVNAGQANKSGDGYPYRYAATAMHVLPVITPKLPQHNGPTVIGDDYVLPGSWIGEVNMNDKNIAQCSPDEPLVIEVWDLS